MDDTVEDAAVETLVEWRPWGQEAFDAAADAGKPVLLSLTAEWCSWCHEMDAVTYAEPRIAAHLDDGFVTVRVDVDRNPRVRDRYNMGGFPSTVFTTPEGEIVTGATFLGPDGMRQAMDGVRRTWDAKGTEAGRVPRALRDPATPSGDLSPDIVEGMVERLAEAFDGEFGGWGRDAKFPHPRTVEFALEHAPDQALRTLDAVETHLYDTYAGGFFRYAEDRDWDSRHHEKTLDANAGLLRAFAEGYRRTGTDAYRDVAEGTVDYLTTTLWTGDAFAASQRADEEYYGLEPTERESTDAPFVDGTVLADWNGLAVDALLAFDAAADHEGARRYAERALRHLLETHVEDGAVVHYRDGAEASERGLLTDQARVLNGLTAAAQGLGEGYVRPARAVADHAVEHLGDDGGSFRDGPADGPGLLDRPLRPLGANVELASGLFDLAALTGADRYRDRARETLEAFAGAADRMGVEGAAYAGAVARALSPRRVEVAAPAGSPLHRAALESADGGTVVVPDAGTDGTATVFEAGDPVLTDAGADRLRTEFSDG